VLPGTATVARPALRLLRRHSRLLDRVGPAFADGWGRLRAADVSNASHSPMSDLRVHIPGSSEHAAHGSEQELRLRSHNDGAAAYEEEHQMASSRGHHSASLYQPTSGFRAATLGFSGAYAYKLRATVRKLNWGPRPDSRRLSLWRACS